MMDVTTLNERIIEVLPKISAWGTAVENGAELENEHLAPLLELSETEEQLMSDAIEYARAFQENVKLPSAPATLAGNDPSHPLQRIARIDTLIDLLGFEPVYNDTPSPEEQNWDELDQLGF